MIVAETDGTVGSVTGTAAASPVEPEIDSDTQIKVALVLVAAGATTPSDVSNEDVYLENTEWTSADSGATIDPDDTSDPYSGSKAVLFDAAGDGDYLTLTDASAHSASEFERFVFRIKNTAANTTNRNRVRIALYNSTSRVSNWIDLQPGSYAFDAADVASYQIISIPMADFGLAGNTFDVVRFEVEAAGANTLSFLLDTVLFQEGVATEDTSDYAKLSVSNDWQKAQGTSLVTLTDGATINWDMDPSNSYQVTLGGNRTMAAPTNVKPGFTYLLYVIQDGTGSRTITWNSVFKWAGGTAPTLSTGAGAKDLISFGADADGNLVGTLAVADYQ